jgi:hypothetical protein
MAPKFTPGMTDWECTREINRDTVQPIVDAVRSGVPVSRVAAVFGTSEDVVESIMSEWMDDNGSTA